MTMWGHGIKLQKVNFTAVMMNNLGKHYVRIHRQVIKVTLEIRCFAHRVDGKQTPALTHHLLQSTMLTEKMDGWMDRV